jgi:hypothetical protein
MRELNSNAVVNELTAVHLDMCAQEGLEQAWTEVQPPEAVECCPIGVGQDWVAFNLCHMRSEWMGSTTTSTDGGEPGAAGEPASGTEQVSP